MGEGWERGWRGEEEERDRNGGRVGERLERGRGGEWQEWWEGRRRMGKRERGKKEKDGNERHVKKQGNDTHSPFLTKARHNPCGIDESRGV
jgi:hypothetical protein